MPDKPRPKSATRPLQRIAAPVVAVNLASELRSLRESPSYRRNDHASTTLVNRLGLGAVLIALPKGAHLDRHRTSRPIVIQVLEGAVRLELDDRTVEMRSGDATSLAPGLAHRLAGVEDGAVLLTMGGARSAA